MRMNFLHKLKEFCHQLASVSLVLKGNSFLALHQERGKASVLLFWEIPPWQEAARAAPCGGAGRAACCLIQHRPQTAQPTTAATLSQLLRSSCGPSSWRNWALRPCIILAQEAEHVVPSAASSPSHVPTCGWCATDDTGGGWRQEAEPENQVASSPHSECILWSETSHYPPSCHNLVRPCGPHS